jgi:hypothetical protein
MRQRERRPLLAPSCVNQTVRRTRRASNHELVVLQSDVLAARVTMGTVLQRRGDAPSPPSSHIAALVPRCRRERHGGHRHGGPAVLRSHPGDVPAAGEAGGGRRPQLALQATLTAERRQWDYRGSGWRSLRPSAPAQRYSPSTDVLMHKPTASPSRTAPLPLLPRRPSRASSTSATSTASGCWAPSPSTSSSTLCRVRRPPGKCVLFCPWEWASLMSVCPRFFLCPAVR